MIGAELDYRSLDQYVVGSTTARLRPVYVGGRTQSGGGTTSNISISLSGLTGGTNTSPQNGDLVIIAIELAGGASTDKASFRISGYTQIADLYAGSPLSSNFQVGYKFMPTTPDTTATITGGNGNTADGYAVVVHVWRSIDTGTVLDVTTTTSVQPGTGLPNAPAITPTTANSVILVAAGTSHTGGVDTYTATELSNFRSVGADDTTSDATTGMGSFDWVSGTFDPATWTFSQADSINFGTNSVTFVLRPALAPAPLYGNYKSSGIWNLESVYDAYSVTGEYLDITTGTSSFTVPKDVFEISAVVVGGGGGGGGGETGRNQGVTGGAGGGLAYGTFAVTPGEVLTVVVGTGGNGGAAGGGNGTAGGASSISRGATVLLQGAGGGAGLERSTATVTGGASTGTARVGGGAGGNSGGNSTDTGSGGGGAGGYSAAGGAGGTTGAGSNSTGGGGGGGGATNSGQGYGGGGVGLLGAGTNGTGGALNTVGSSTGGSGGANGTRAAGGAYGGGGGACDDDTDGAGGAGGQGAVRIIWGPGRAYPSTKVT